MNEPLWTRDVYIGPTAAQIYTECAEIYNPIHTERRVALAAGLPDIILHGSATQAIALSQIVEVALGGDPGCVRRSYCQNRAMARLDTTLTVRSLAEQVQDDEQTVFFDVRTQDGEPALANGVLIAQLR